MGFVASSADERAARGEPAVDKAHDGAEVRVADLGPGGRIDDVLSFVLVDAL